MSKSYKKNPIVKDGKGATIAKRFANKKVRRYQKDLSDGSSYRKIYPQWNIHDWVSRQTKADFMAKFESDVKRHIAGEQYYKRMTPYELDLNYQLNHWSRFYYRK